MREAHRSLCAKMQKRSKIVPRACSTVFGAPNALGQHSVVVWDRLGTGPGTFLDGSWALLARRGRPRIGPGVAFCRPGPFLSASWRVPETALSAQNRPRPNFQRFFIDLDRFFIDLRSILASSGTLFEQSCDRSCCSESRNEATHRDAPASIEQSFEQNIVRTCKPPPSSN